MEVEELQDHWESTVRLHDIDVKAAKAGILEAELSSHTMVVALIKGEGRPVYGPVYGSVSEHGGVSH